MLTPVLKFPPLPVHNHFPGLLVNLQKKYLNVALHHYHQNAFRIIWVESLVWELYGLLIFSDDLVLSRPLKESLNINCLFLNILLLVQK